nr:hypothetical protein [Tanacetum cinerariifolium]
EQQRLLLKLMPYDFSIHYRAGKNNRGADALSRMPHSGELLTLTIPYCVEVENIKSWLHTDPFTSDIIQRLLSDPTVVLDFHLVDQILFYKNRLVIPEEDISMDFIVGLPPSNRFDTILVVVDRLSKYAYFIYLSRPFTAKSVASEDISMDFIVGLPPSNRFDTILVVVDRLSKYAYFIYLSRSFTARSVASPTKWSSYLPWAELSYNTRYHTSTGTTSFSVVYGRESPPLFPYVSGETKNNELEQQLITRDDMIKLIRLNLSRAQDRMRNQANS